MIQYFNWKKAVLVWSSVFLVFLIGSAIFFFSKQETAVRRPVVTETDITQRDIVSICTFFGRQDIAPDYTGSGTSSYNETVPTRIYNVGADQIEVDARSGKVIQFGTRSLPVGSEAGQGGIAIPDFQSGNAELSAQQFIQKNIPNMNFDSLTPNHGSKGESRFFRWEDRSRTMTEGHPFVQVGFSQRNVLIEYTNAL